MEIKQEVFTVEYAEPHAEVVYYREIQAIGIEDAKLQILLLHPGANIRAVTRNE
ncbi:hypothetical protein FHS18_006720 [Paenibacillus phyllosphaerae]|uniref:Uncharacterized protein n=1 Tax=Paenibacillus phyllosphaerae TaxID=274593 RepID=A0A7W5FRQ4_9BACL|nr:hypothetical protein [Paenibacillus phyllosphaerae]MBB3114598.1 hypothetical protein [Paenibacillus phyllosphaerae]